MVIDCHMHIRGNADGSLDRSYCDGTMEAGDLLGIDVFCISDINLRGPLRYEDFHASNDRVKAAVEAYPGRYLGYCFVNPGDKRALEEVRQRVKDEGFIGIKLYNQYPIDDPVHEPLIELATEWQIPILMHAGYATDPATRARQPNISNARHFVNVAERYPDAILIEAHIGGGGDWEWCIKHLREAPSVYFDTSGSVIDEWVVDTCIKELGVDRMLFATDMTMEGGVGKILDADLTEEERTRVLGDNFQAILDRRSVC
jgi:predicted TIM-barrel fold metal-dependent hydrolase